MPEPKDPGSKLGLMVTQADRPATYFAVPRLKGLAKHKGIIDHQIIRLDKPIMILPQVHLRKPCYDFYFL